MVVGEQKRRPSRNPGSTLPISSLLESGSRPSPMPEFHRSARPARPRTERTALFFVKLQNCTMRNHPCRATEGMECVQEVFIVLRYQLRGISVVASAPAVTQVSKPTVTLPKEQAEPRGPERALSYSEFPPYAIRSAPLQKVLKVDATRVTERPYSE